MRSASRDLAVALLGGAVRGDDRGGFRLQLVIDNFPVRLGHLGVGFGNIVFFLKLVSATILLGNRTIDVGYFNP